MTLSRLERSGHVRIVRRRIVILDTAGLEALAFRAPVRRGKAKASLARGDNHRAASHP